MKAFNKIEFSLNFVHSLTFWDRGVQQDWVSAEAGHLSIVIKGNMKTAQIFAVGVVLHH